MRYEDYEKWALANPDKWAGFSFWVKWEKPTLEMPVDFGSEDKETRTQEDQLEFLYDKWLKGESINESVAAYFTHTESKYAIEVLGDEYFA